MEKRHFNLKDKTGEVFITKDGYKVEVIEYINSTNMTVVFECGQVIKGVDRRALNKGILRYKNKPSVYGVGYTGYGEHRTKDSEGKELKVYGTWRGMLRRCYYLPHQEKHQTYKGCSVVEEWHNFQNFAEWWYKNWKDYMDDFWQLDKDILIKGNKVYSPETCCLVPHEINQLFVNNDKDNTSKGIRKEGNKFKVVTYRYGKENYIGMFEDIEKAIENRNMHIELHLKEVADKWKDKINQKVYEAMYKYKVEISN